MLFETVPHSDSHSAAALYGLSRPILRHIHSHCRFFRLDSTPIRSGKRTHQRRLRPAFPRGSQAQHAAVQSTIAVVAGSRDSEDVAVVWSCLVVSVDRLSGFVLFRSIPSVVARFLHDRAVPDSPRRCVIATLESKVTQNKTRRPRG